MSFPGLACRDLADYALWCWRRSDAMKDMAFYSVARRGFSWWFEPSGRRCSGLTHRTYSDIYNNGRSAELPTTCPETTEPESTICS